MTTLAYHHESGTIAADSRVTDRDGRILTDDADKMKIEQGKTFFITGSVADFEPAVADWLAGKANRLSAHGFLIESGKVYVWGNDLDDGPWKEPVECNHALGGGRDYATAAMDFGKTARGAVLYAMTRDSRTGGRVRVFDVTTGGLVNGEQ